MTTKKASSHELPSLPAGLVDQFVKGPMTAEAVQDLYMAFKKAPIERAMGAELGHHLGYPPSERPPGDQPGQRSKHQDRTDR
jgi:putative transposase